MPAKFSRALRAGFVVLAAACALGPATSQAFTLIPIVKLFINAPSGYPTSNVQVRGSYSTGATCPAGVVVSYTFNFYFDSPLVWSKTVPCNPTTNNWDTGNSPFFKPPVPTVGTHVISLKVMSALGAQVGNTQQSNYKIVSPPPPPPPPPPVTHPSPTPTPSPSPPPSPTSVSCPAAMLPPTGTGSWGDNLIAGLVVASVLPLVGLTLFGPNTLLAFARRRRRLLMLIGLSALTALTLSCTTIGSNSGNPTPAALISPPASPSSCSA